MFAVDSAVYQIHMSAAYATHTHVYTFVVCSLTRKIAFCFIYVCVCVIHAKIHVMDCPSSGWWSLVETVSFCLGLFARTGRDAVATVTKSYSVVTFAHINTFLLYLLWWRHYLLNTHTHTYTPIPLHSPISVQRIS